MKIIVHEIEAKETWPLRLEILRPGQTLKHVQYPEDDLPEVIHFGAFDSHQHTNLKQSLVGIVSLYREPFKPQTNIKIDKQTMQNVTWRLRGMAVTQISRTRNVGTALLNACYRHILAINKDSGIWCNARSTAIPYYLKNGFVVIGEEFNIPNIGPHCQMIKELGLIKSFT